MPVSAREGSARDSRARLGVFRRAADRNTRVACATLRLAGRTIALKASTKLPVQKTFSLAASERFVVAWLH